VTGDAFLVIGPAMAAVAAYRVNFTFEFVTGHVITPVHEISVRPVSKLHGRLNFIVVSVAISAERLLVADTAGTLFRLGRKAVIFDK